MINCYESDDNQDDIVSDFSAVRLGVFSYSLKVSVFPEAAVFLVALTFVPVHAFCCDAGL